ncbi:MAG: GFA family protein [Candidatus Margulisbacteria bacterium]|nr:GFA family protein [Candidatus Margulisiibacteriota bacterium]
MNRAIKGQCLCGYIKYKYLGPTGKIVHCHCSKCRKWHGSPYRSRIVIRRDGFKWISGEDHLSFYDSSENVTKSFCKHCGSNLVSFYKNNNTILGLPLGGIEGDLNDIEQIHILTKYKALWYQISDNYEQYAELPVDPSIIRKIVE